MIFIAEAKDVRHHAEHPVRSREAARAGGTAVGERSERGARPGPPPPNGDTRRRVLLIEDDADIAEAIGYQMEKAGLAVRVARTGEEGLEAVRRGVDLVLLDLNLPGMDGLEVCRMIRRQQTTAHLPIIIVSARADEVDRVLGLEMGADDYVVKPFSLKELAARAKVALRRNAAGAEPAQGYRDENWEIEFDAYVVRYKGQEVRLTHKEFELFRYLVERPGRVLDARAAARARLGLGEGHRRAQHRRAHPQAAAQARRGPQPRRDGGRARLPLREVAEFPRPRPNPANPGGPSGVA